MRDIDVRRVLLNDIGLQHANEPETRIVEELGLCRGAARVDIAVVNGNLHGYEIKSERDTLDRLPIQSLAYSRALDYVTVVASAKHLGKVQKMVPKWWGLQEARKADSGLNIEVVRQGCVNPHVTPLAVIQLLWREEALTVLEEYELAYGFRSKTRAQMCDRLVEVLPVAQLTSAVRARLKARVGWRVGSR